MKVTLTKSALVPVGDVDVDGLADIMGFGGFTPAFDVSWSFVGVLL